MPAEPRSKGSVDGQQTVKEAVEGKAYCGGILWRDSILRTGGGPRVRLRWSMQRSGGRCF